jgi:hypothetical protein
LEQGGEAHGVAVEFAAQVHHRASILVLGALSLETFGISIASFV